jgi:SAM-dependent methyltransferase
MTTPTADEIRATVARSYGDRVSRILQRAEPLELAGSGDACCSDSCCGDSEADSLSHVEKLYAATDIGDLPATVTDVAFGCGNPTAIAAMREGEVVLDLGSGGGIDCFLAAKMVGPSGYVFGVDMTPNMISLARSNAGRVGASNVEFRLGEIEHLPIADQSIDVVISNCVINLAPDKAQVFREAFRVLKPGGRLQVSDMIWDGPRPSAEKADLESWAGCVAGALPRDEYIAAIEGAGFTSIAVEVHASDSVAGLGSAEVYARKP